MTKYRLIVKQPIKLLEALLDLFCCDARLAFEGDLSKCDLRGIPILARDSAGVLKRSATDPTQGFVVLPIEPTTKDLIKRQVLPQAGLRHRICHILIESSGELAFSSYDCFDPDCVVLNAPSTEEFLSSLVKSKAIKSYHVEPG